MSNLVRTIKSVHFTIHLHTPVLSEPQLVWVAPLIRVHLKNRISFNLLQSGILQGHLEVEVITQV